MDNNSFKKILEKRIIILDGAMGTMLQKENLSELDYRGELFKNSKINLKGNNDILSITAPNYIEKIHKLYLEAGADIIECNTFGANSISQKDYNLQNYVKEINKASVKIARNIANKYSTKDKPRFIAGSIGPTTKSASISPDINNPANRNITFDELVEAYSEQIEIFVEENVDLLIVETVFDTLNAKAALYSIRKILKEKNKDIPIMVSVTLTDKSGRTLSGQTLEAFYYSIEFAKPAIIGLNCSMGIDSMIPYIERLDKIASCGISVYANAGLPDEFGQYNDSPEVMASGYEKLAKKRLLNICGGCCGTTPEHIKLISETMKKYPPKIIDIQKGSNSTHFCGLDPFIYDGNQNFIMIGEKTNVTGSKKFARLISEKKFDEAIEVAKKQIENGANIIDISMDLEMTDVKDNMKTFLNLIASEPDVAKVPIMIDTLDINVVEAGMKCIQSKPIINSISLKSGEETFIKNARIIKDLGGSVVVMAFDEKGQATGIDDRIEIITRAYEILTKECGFKDNNIIFDLNVFPLATGLKEHNNNAVSFIKALKYLKNKYPKCLFSGGISNISFSFRGMNKIREAIHTVFLYHAIKAGLTMGIVNTEMLMTYDEIDEPLKTLAENLVLNKTEDAADKLLEYAQKIKNTTENNSTKKEDDWRNLSVEERLHYSLIKGTSEYLNQDLTEALNKYSPIEIIEKVLLEGMNIVGKYFGDGKMFLPQVVKSSRIMKEAVDILQSKFKTNGNKKIGKIVLATVNGDVHDIGKNIISLIFMCNNFKVVDLGVMVKASDILESARKENADIIALSGLITPSLEEMCIVAQRMTEEGFELPALMIGGATTSKKHTAIKIAPKYSGLVVHTENASDAAVAAQKIALKDKDFIQTIKKEQAEIMKEYLKNEKEHNRKDKRTSVSI